MKAKITAKIPLRANLGLSGRPKNNSIRLFPSYEASLKLAIMQSCKWQRQDRPSVECCSSYFSKSDCVNDNTPELR